MKNNDEHRFLGVPFWKWQILTGFIAVIGFGGAAGTGLIAIWELRENRQAARVSETLDLLDTWEEGKYLAAFRRLDGQVAARLALVPHEDLEAAREDPVILGRLYERVSGDVLTAPEAEEDFDKLVYFFQRLSICVEEALCAREPTLAFFRGPMQSFARTFEAEIEVRRGISPDFANGLDLVE